MALVYVGIDEAGYGPMLGPLTVGMSAWLVRAWSPDEGPPDLWSLLSAAVCRAAADKRGRIPIADSKKLKLPNTSKTKHPLTHLERGVLASLASIDQLPNTAAGLFERFGCALDQRPWYAAAEGGEQGEPLPVCGDAARLAIDGNTLRAACGRAGVELLGVSCRALCERHFNQVVRAEGTKAAATARAITSLLGEVVERWGGAGELRVVCDRQGGRTDYQALLGRALPGGRITAARRGEAWSRYAFEGGGAHGAALFATEAESRHLPVALASMTAKLVRELAMMRFNAYWTARLPELKPTAGYVTDARRWLRDASRTLTDDEREALIRIA